MAKLEISDLTKIYEDKIPVVDNINLEIEENEFATIVGPSGCGKTTTLRMIAGFTEPQKGIISIDGQEIVNKEYNIFIPPERREIGMVFQTYAVWPHMDVFNNVAYPLKLRKEDKKTIKKKTEEILRIVDLQSFASRHPNELSGGQQQRVALARALVMKPKLLLLDEPLSNLDASLREQMRSEIKEIQKRMKVTIINVTHDQVEAMSMSDKVIVMKKGKIIQTGTPEDLYQNPSNSFVAGFIGSANTLPCQWIQDISDKNMLVKIFNETVSVKRKEKQSSKGLLAIRPNKIEFDRDSQIKGSIKRKLYLGPSIEYYVSVEEAMLRVLAEASHNYDIGDTVGLKIHDAVWLNH